MREGGEQQSLVEHICCYSLLFVYFCCCCYIREKGEREREKGERGRGERKGLQKLSQLKKYCVYEYVDVYV